MHFIGYFFAPSWGLETYEDCLDVFRLDGTRIFALF